MNFLAGNNFDKVKSLKITKKINRDPHIIKLIRVGKNPWKHFFYLLIFMAFFYFNSKDLFNKIKGYTTEGNDLFDQAFVVLIFFVVWEFINIRSSIHSQSKDIFNLWTYFKYARSKKSPSYPSDLWHYFGANPSDSQILIPASNLAKENTFIYTGQPYFEIRCIDTVKLKYTGTIWDYLKLRKSYTKLFKNFAIRTLTSYTDQNQVASEERRLKNSFATFGILFFSEVLKTFFEHPKLRSSTQEDGRVQIQIAVDDEIHMEFAEEWLKLCTNMNVAEIAKIDSRQLENPMFIVNELTFLEESKKKKLFRKWHQFWSKELEIPAKRFIALPTKNSKVNSLLNAENPTQLMSLGGAEQNLGLMYLVNAARWKQSSYIGIAENIFDDYRHLQFSIGTESLVYGVKNEMIGRGDGIKKRESDTAEVFSFFINNLEILCVYGYSAPITKMAALQLLKKIEQDEHQSIPTKATQIKNSLVYKVRWQGPSFYESDVMQKWDSEDHINGAYEQFLEETIFEIT